MQRVSIEFPSPILYSYTFTINADDINIADHMGNERILVLANTLREKMFEHLQIPLFDLQNRHGIVVANHCIQYKSEGFLGDEILLNAAVNDITECSFDLYFQFLKNNGKTMALLKTGCVYFDFETRKIMALPESYLRAFHKNISI